MPLEVPVKAARYFETAPLVLARPEATDAVTMFERYTSDPEVTRFVGRPRHQSVSDTQAFLKFSAEEWERSSHLLDALAALSHIANFSVGCYCEDEHRCHRSVLRSELERRGARLR